MIRFAVTVTAIEIALTILASLLIAMTELPDPYLTETDLEDLGLKYENHRVRKNQRFRTLIQYNTYVDLKEPDRTLYTSMRQNDSAIDFDLRRQREEGWASDPERGELVIVDEPLPGLRDQTGYSVRHYRKDSVRVEVVRARGNEMLIVRVVCDNVTGGRARWTMSRSERQARLIMMKLLDRLRWR